jgi:serine/threonine protein phosphatase 1
MDIEVKNRDAEMEKRLQDALDAGHHVWVVGDVHGYENTMQELVKCLNLSESDWVVFLGDLIDRGPNSYAVVKAVYEHPQMTSVLGNHEMMMLELFHQDRISSFDDDIHLWWRNGGSSTVYSYEKAFGLDEGGLRNESMYACVGKHQEWMVTLPSHIVLNEWRLVHAGYRPGIPLDEQSEEDYLWIRDSFYQANKPIDPMRTIIFGHTPTVGLPGFSKDDWGKVWKSKILLDDGRNSLIGIDTCLFHGQNGAKKLTAFDLQSQEVIQQERVEP